MNPTVVLMRAAVAALLEQAAALSAEIARIEGRDPAQINAGDPAQINAGDPAQINAGDPAQINAGDPAEFTAGDPAEFAHITHPEVRAALAAGPVGDWTDTFTQASLRTFGAFEADRDDRDNDLPAREEAALALHDAYLPDVGDRDRAKGWRALYRFWMDRDPPAPRDDTSPYLALFQGQATIMDHDMPVDDARWTYPVTAAEYRDAYLRQEYFAFDDLQDAAAAPDAAKQWRGPFCIVVMARRFRIESDAADTLPLYADTPEAVQAALRDLFQSDADLEGLDEIEADLAAQIKAFPRFDLTPGQSYDFNGHGYSQRVTVQWRSPLENEPADG